MCRFELRDIPCRILSEIKGMSLILCKIGCELEFHIKKIF